jgi:diguanylate cyclase (GGDEF)-like protein/PAS domain S-box-containing protein
VLGAAIVGGITGELYGLHAAGAACNGVYSVRLMRHAWRTHITHRSGVCRSAGLLGLGLLIVSLTGAGVVAGLAAGLTERSAAYLTATGLVLSAGAFVPALLLLPGAPGSALARLRRAVDGVTMAVCLLFSAWVLVIAPNLNVDAFGFWIAVLSCCVLCIAVVAALRAASAFRGAAACATAVAVAVLGLGAFAFSLANEALAALLPISAALVAAAGVLAWSGASRPAPALEFSPPDATPTLAGYPVLAVPAAAAVAVALHRLVTVGRFDRASVVLGVMAIVVLALREAVTAIDVSSYTRRVTAQVARFRSLVAASTDVMMVVDSELVVRWQSQAAARQLGLSDADVVGRNLLSMVHPDDAGVFAQRLADVRAGLGTGVDGEPPALVEARIRDGFGKWRETESSMSDQRDVPEVAGLVVHIRDVSERKAMERTLRQLAYADRLTGLANRRQTLQSVMALRSAPRVRGALILVELDGCPAVTDGGGGEVADAVLIEVAQRLRAEAEDSDVPSRLTGDEFAIVTEAGPVQAYALANRLLTVLAEPVVLPETTVRLTASIGLTDLAGGADPEEVLRRAELALLRSRQLGRGRVEWYDDVAEAAMVRRMTLERELPGAVARGELDLVYQPILDLSALRPVGVEALLRWRHPRMGTLLPGDVIPVAEDSGVMNRVGAWVLDRAGRQLGTWLREGRDLSMAVNISGRQLDGPDLVGELAGVLDRHDVPPERFVFEVAEAELEPDGAMGERLSRLRSLGIRTALDDFGTGPDSLAHLRRLPMDMVKIGRSFFDEAASAESGRTLPVIDVMVGLGRRLGIEVVALGLEAPAELQAVRDAGCRLGQGHLFARPQPAERAEAYLDGFPARSG